MFRRNKVLTVAVIALIISLALIIIIATVDTKPAEKPTAPELLIEWSAVQKPGSNIATITAEVYLKYAELKADAAEQNTVSVSGNVKTFLTEAMNFSEPGKTMLTTFTVTVPRPIGTNVNCPIDAVWNFGGEKITSAVTATLDDKIVEADTAQTTARPDTGKESTSSTDPPVTDPPVTDPPVTDPVVKPLFKTWEFRSDTGKHVYAKLEVTAASEEDDPKAIKVYANLFMDYHSLYMNERHGCILEVGNASQEFAIYTIEEPNNILHSQFLVTVELEAEYGDTVDLYVNIPFNGTYGSTYIDNLRIDEAIVLK